MNPVCCRYGRLNIRDGYTVSYLYHVPLIGEFAQAEHPSEPRMSNPMPVTGSGPGFIPGGAGRLPGKVGRAGSPGSSSGRTRGFGPLNGGSNSSPRAISLCQTCPEFNGL